MGKLILYGVEPSPAVRAVLLTLYALDLDFEFKEINMLEFEHKSEGFLKKNPQGVVPVLEDGEHILCESHAITAYLVRKYGKDDSLYPKDFYKRAIVDHRLHFHSGILFPRIRNITVPLLFQKENRSTPEAIASIYESYDLLETFLKDDYVAGTNLTIADFSLVATITSPGLLAPIDAEKYPRVTAWIKRMAELPYYKKANRHGAEIYVKMLNKLLRKYY